MKNGGTRAFDNPEGTTPAEMESNIFTDFTAELCEKLDVNDREWLVESSAADGRYPKIWDRRPLRRSRAKTGAKMI